jgi:hypothetical protein
MTLIIKQPEALQADIGATRVHRWTAEEYIQLAAGPLALKRTELIDGEIFDVTSQNNPHVLGISNINRLLLALFDEKHYWVTCQSTVRLPKGDMPDPDFAVRPGPGSSDNAHQPLPLLIIEISDDTLLFDRSKKRDMYAANLIGDYWIVNVREKQVEVYRDPIEDASRKRGWRYNSIAVFKAPAELWPLAKADAQIDLARVFAGL